MSIWKPIATQEQVRGLLGSRESNILEFKQDYAYKGTSIQFGDDLARIRKIEADKAEFARDVAQFCNAEGGSLVIGVKERGGVAVEFTGIGDLENFRSFVIDRCHRNLYPAVPLHAEEHVIDGASVCVVNIPPTEETVAVVVIQNEGEQISLEYLRRVGERKRWMRPEQVQGRAEPRARRLFLKARRIHDDTRNMDVLLPPQTIGVFQFDRWEAWMNPVYIRTREVTEDALILNAYCGGSFPSKITVSWAHVRDILQEGPNMRLELISKLAVRHGENGTWVFEPFYLPGS